MLQGDTAEEETDDSTHRHCITEEVARIGDESYQ